jgi:hypothetical protein
MAMRTFTPWLLDITPLGLPLNSQSGAEPGEAPHDAGERWYSFLCRQLVHEADLASPITDTQPKEDNCAAHHLDERERGRCGAIVPAIVSRLLLWYAIANPVQ